MDCGLAFESSFTLCCLHLQEITGKRTRQNVDGSRVTKVFLDARDQNALEHKVDSFSSVYKRLTGKEVSWQRQTESSETSALTLRSLRSTLSSKSRRPTEAFSWLPSVFCIPSYITAMLSTRFDARIRHRERSQLRVALR